MTRAHARAGVAVVLALLGMLAPAFARGQNAEPLVFDPDLAITQYIHDVWQVQDGLPQSSIDDILQTRDGYLWLATQEGLARFDGVSFTVFDRHLEAGLANNVIRVLHESRDGTLWIGTEGGLTRFRDGRFRTYTTADGLPGNVVRALHEDRNGHLWIGTLGDGLARFDGRRFHPIPDPAGLLREAAGIILSLEEDQDGTLWIGTATGLFSYRGGALAPFSSHTALPGREIWSLLATPDGGLWIGTDGGLALLRNATLRPFPGRERLRGRRVSTLLRDPVGTIWIGTLDEGLYRLAGGTVSAFNQKAGLTHDLVRALYLDREGSLWIGTDGGGLNRLRPGKLTSLKTAEGLSHDVVLSVLEDRNGVLWAGTDGGGLNRIEGGEVTHFGTSEGLTSLYVYALHEDASGRLWAGTRGGLCRLDGRRFHCLTQRDGLSHDEIFAIEDDRNGTLWVGTLHGVDRLQDGRLVSLEADSLLADALVTSLHEDASGNMWVGTYGSGLFRFTDGRVRRFDVTDGLTNPFVLPLYEDLSGDLWIGLMDGGLCRYGAPDRFECATSADGLYNDKILQILDDGLGYLWLGTQRGIFQISREEFDAFVRGRRDGVASHVYGEVDGLPHRELNGGAQPGAWRRRDGSLWFSTIGGLASVYPHRIRRNAVPPPVHLEAVHVNGQPVALAPGARFAPGARDFAFRYTALSLAAPERVRFRYRLEPYDDDWIDAGTRREAYYTNLPPGTYRFRVSASNNDGLWNEVGTVHTFHVAPYFYQTTWFYLLCLLAAAFFGWRLYRWRVQHLRARQAELTALVAEQTRELREREQALQELNANLEREVHRQLEVILVERRRYEGELIEAKEKAEASARLKTTILRNMSHEIRTPIHAILGFADILSEEVGQAQQEFVGYISENGRRLLTTLNSILDLAKLETHQVLLDFQPVDCCAVVRETATLLAPIARLKHIDLRTSVPAGAVVARLDRSGLERILQNVIGNAMKFTDEGEVAVTLDVHDRQARIEVRDTGIGISETFLPHVFEEFQQESTGLDRTHEGNGLGLTITLRLVEALGGTIKVSSEKNVGTTVTIRFPLADAASASQAPSPVRATLNGEPEEVAR